MPDATSLLPTPPPAPSPTTPPTILAAATSASTPVAAATAFATGPPEARQTPVTDVTQTPIVLEPTPASQPPVEDGEGTGLTIGIVIAVAIGVAATIGVAIGFYLRGRRNLV